MNSSVTTTSSRKSFPPAAITYPHRNAPSMIKTSPVNVLSFQQQPSKSAKPRSPIKRLPKSAQESQTADESSSSSPLTYKKQRSNRPPGKALSTGSLDVKISKALSQESVVILKRGENPALLADPFNIPRPDNASSDRGERNHRFTSKERSFSRDPSPSRRRNIQPTPKSRRAQRRKEVKTIADDFQNAEADVLLGTSPPQPTGSTSSGESSEDVLITSNQKIVTVAKGETKRRRRRERVSSSPPMTNSAAIFPPLPAATVVQDTVVEEVKSSSLKVTFAKSVNQARRGSSPAVEIMHYVTPLVATGPASLPSAPLSDPFVKSAPRTPMASSTTYPPQNKASPLYAGPTFSNSPAPNALPLPSFNSRSSTESSPPILDFSRSNFHPTTPTPQRLRTTSASSFLNRGPGFDLDEGIFGMDGLHDPIVPMNQQDLRARSRDLLGLLSTSIAIQQKPAPQPVNNNAISHPILQGYHLPLKMMTSHPPQDEITREMTMGIRSMLKIE